MRWYTVFAVVAVVAFGAGDASAQTPKGQFQGDGDLRGYVNRLSSSSTKYLMPDGTVLSQAEFNDMQMQKTEDLKRQMAKSGSRQINRASGNIIDSRKGVKMVAYAAPTEKTSLFARVIEQINPFSGATSKTVRFSPIGARPPVDGTPATFTMPK